MTNPTKNMPGRRKPLTTMVPPPLLKATPARRPDVSGPVRVCSRPVTDLAALRRFHETVRPEPPRERIDYARLSSGETTEDQRIRRVETSMACADLLNWALGLRPMSEFPHVVTPDETLIDFGAGLVLKGTPSSP